MAMAIQFDQVSIPCAKSLVNQIEKKYAINRQSSHNIPKTKDLRPIFQKFLESAQEAWKKISEEKEDPLQKFSHLYVLSQQIQEALNFDFTKSTESLEFEKFQNLISSAYRNIENYIAEQDLANPFFYEISLHKQDEDFIFQIHIDFGDENKKYPFPLDFEKAKTKISKSSLSSFMKLTLWKSYYEQVERLKKKLEGYHILHLKHPSSHRSKEKREHLLHFVTSISNPSFPKEIETLSQQILSKSKEEEEQSFQEVCLKLFEAIRKFREQLSIARMQIKEMAPSISINEKCPDALINFIEAKYGDKKDLDGLIKFADPYGALRAFKIIRFDYDCVKKINKLSKFFKKMHRHKPSTSVESITQRWCEMIPPIAPGMSPHESHHKELSQIYQSLAASIPNLAEIKGRPAIEELQKRVYSLYCSIYLATVIDPEGIRRLKMINRIHCIAQKCLQYGQLECAMQISTKRVPEEKHEKRLSFLYNDVTVFLKVKKLQEATHSKLNFVDFTQQLTMASLKTEQIHHLAFRFHLMDVCYFLKLPNILYEKNIKESSEWKQWMNIEEKFSSYLNLLMGSAKPGEKLNVIGQWILIIHRMLILGSLNFSFIFFNKIQNYLNEERALLPQLLKKKKYKRPYESLAAYFPAATLKETPFLKNFPKEYLAPDTPMVPFIFQKIDEIEAIDDNSSWHELYKDINRHLFSVAQLGLKYWQILHEDLQEEGLLNMIENF